MRLPIPFLRSAPDLSSAGWDDEYNGVAVALRSYAEHSLSPDEPTLTRVGATVRAAFIEATTARLASLSVVSGLTVGAGWDGAAEGRRLKPSWRRHRAFAAACTIALLGLSTVGLATAQSGPGQPFYRLRLGIEAVNLPANGSESRLTADLNRADARIGEIAAGAASSDWSGAADAAAAYREGISDMTLPTVASSKAKAVQRLDEQLAHLEQLRGSSHGAETPALDGAIAALCRILGIPVPTPTPAPAPVTSPRPEASIGVESRETAEPRATAGETGGGSELGHSPRPTTPSDGGTDNSGGNSAADGSGNSGVDNGGPSARPSDHNPKAPGPSDPPGESH